MAEPERRPLSDADRFACIVGMRDIVKVIFEVQKAMDGAFIALVEHVDQDPFGEVAAAAFDEAAEDAMHLSKGLRALVAEIHKVTSPPREAVQLDAFSGESAR